VSQLSPKYTGFEDGLYALEGADDAKMIETDFLLFKKHARLSRPNPRSSLS